MGHINIGCGAVCSCRSNLAACGYPRALGVRRHTCGLVQGSRWGGFVAVRVVPVCAVEVGSAWSRRSWRATFRATKRLAIAENIYKSQRDSSLGLFAVCVLVEFRFLASVMCSIRLDHGSMLSLFEGPVRRRDFIPER